MSVFTFLSPFVRLPLPLSSPSSSYSPISPLPPSSLQTPVVMCYQLPSPALEGEEELARELELDTTIWALSTILPLPYMGHKPQGKKVGSQYTHAQHTLHKHMLKHIHPHPTHCEIFTPPTHTLTPSHPHTAGAGLSCGGYLDTPLLQQQAWVQYEPIPTPLLRLP